MDENIVKCPVCKGWGSKEMPLKKNYIICDFCKGESVQLYSQDFYVTWNIPSYIDYGQRQSNNIRKIFLLIVPLIVGASLIITLIYLLINSFK